MSHSPTDRKGKVKRQIIMALKVVILVLVVVGITRAVNQGWSQLQEYDFRLSWSGLGWMLVSGLLYTLGLMPIGLYWHRVLIAMEQSPPFAATMRAYFLGHLGKYVPGKAMVVVLRTGSLRQTNSTVTAISVFAETLSMMAVGAFIAAAVIAVSFADQVGFLLVAIGLMLVAGLPTFPPVFRFIVLTLKVDRVDESVQRALGFYSWPLVIRGWAASFIGWLIMATSLWAVLQVIVVDGSQVGFVAAYPRMLASVSLAVVAGFLSLLPGGVGVRELVFNELLMDPFGPVVAIICPVLLRLTWLIAELVMAGALQLFVRDSVPRCSGNERPP